MASPLTDRVIQNTKTDPESGCIGIESDSAFQLCKQNYLLEKQNQIIQSENVQTQESVKADEPAPATQSPVMEKLFWSGWAVAVLLLIVLLLAIKKLKK